MRFSSFSGKSTVTLPRNRAGISRLRFVGGRTAYFADASSSKRFGNNHVASFVSKEKKGGIIRVFGNGTVTYTGMRSAAQAKDAVRALSAAFDSAAGAPKVEVTRVLGTQKLNRNINLKDAYDNLAAAATEDEAFHNLRRSNESIAAVTVRHEDDIVLIYRSGAVTVNGRSTESARETMRAVEAALV